MSDMARNTVCLWYDRDAEAAARFCAATFPDAAVSAVQRAPSDDPNGKAGGVLTVLGMPCLGLNGGPEFRHSEAFSFQVATDTQEETDRDWSALVANGGQDSQCGRCQDRCGSVLADYAARADAGDCRSRSGRPPTRVRGHGAAAQDRHRRDRGRAPRLRLAPGRAPSKRAAPHGACATRALAAPRRWPGRQPPAWCT